MSAQPGRIVDALDDAESLLAAVAGGREETP
jgi:hypothetical protein